MNIHKTVVILLALLLAGMAMVPMVSAFENNSDALNVDTSLNRGSPDVQFDGLSQKDAQTSLGGTDLKSISPSIKKYEIITIDVSTLKKQLQSGQKIPIHLKGIPYVMNLHEDTIYPSAETGVYTFTGNLESINDGNTIADSEIHLTMDDTGVIGKISLDPFTYWYIDEIEGDRSSALPGSIQYTYYSGDVEQTISPMGEDRYVILPSGESKPITGLSDEELRQFIADSPKRQKSPATITGELDWYDISILVVCDNQMYNRYSNWVKRAQSVVSDANTAMSYSDIKIRLVPTYDASRRFDLSNNFNATTPLEVFTQYVNYSYLDDQDTDIAMYLSGNQFTNYIGSSNIFDNGYGFNRHGVMMYESSAGGGYGANPQERANVFTHEVGHMLDADHEVPSSPIPQEPYNRATTYDISGTTYHTLMYSSVTTDPTYFSSDDPVGGITRGNATCDNSRRLRETKASIAGYT
ncbi:MAG: zinc-dependent metalloprotease [Methanoregula sp.]|uniref:M12 family metallo-peptidase n=1 Tax=Methanoregula sp. TaxID=2052170 RepID=UPI0025E68AB4|nr:M12 family metallo-peptidase [Methanoregula sp.]MCK9632557.1 zinc-dependent metalloprotease [Methanoregula sp.]